MTEADALLVSRPASALTFELAVRINRTLSELDADPTCRVIVLTGAGRGFCAGLDLVGSRHEEQVDPVSRTRGQDSFSNVVRTLRAIRPVVIAAVNGPVAGAGFGICLGTDIRIASRSARFHPAAIKIGISSGECGTSYFLPRLVGAARAYEILLTGRPFDAAEADRIGLVTRVVEDEQLLDAALALAAEIAANSPFAVWMTKKVLRTNADLPFEAALELENRTQSLAGLTADSMEAITAFVEKRPPVCHDR
jgi:enoyl-CoA hydratase